MNRNLPTLFKERLYQAAGVQDDTLGGWLAATGIGVGVAQTIRDRGGIPSAEKLVAIAGAVGKSVDWLLGIDNAATQEIAQIREVGGKMTQEFAYVPRYDVQASAGTGHWVGEDRPARFTMAFRREWIDRTLHTNPKDLSVIAVVGDSMEPTLIAGDNILVNHARNTVEDGLYVLRVHDDVLVKRLQRMSRDKVLIISENKRYKPIEWNFDDPCQTDWYVIGRVVWFGRKI